MIFDISTIVSRMPVVISGFFSVGWNMPSEGAIISVFPHFWSSLPSTKDTWVQLPIPVQLHHGAKQSYLNPRNTHKQPINLLCHAHFRLAGISCFILCQGPRCYHHICCSCIASTPPYCPPLLPAPNPYLSYHLTFYRHSGGGRGARSAFRNQWR